MLDLVIEVVKKYNVEFIIVNDLDVDCLVVVLLDVEGNWKFFYGNVIGCYLGWYLVK